MVSWNAESDRALLFVIILTGNLTSFKWNEIAVGMEQKGFSITAEACRQRFQKLKRDHKNGKPPAHGPTPASPATPKAQPRSRKPKAKSTTTKSYIDLSNENGNDNTESNGDDDEELGSPSPLKRKRMVKDEDEENGQSAPLFKMEHADTRLPIDLEQDDIYYDDEYA